MSKSIHLVKLSVGTKSIEDLTEWQSSSVMQSSDSCPRHVTRMWPKREEELLNGGSIYWVFRGLILARQEIIGFQEIIGQDKISRCGLILSTVIYKTKPQPKKAFQGWRYLKNEDSPIDVGKYNQKEALPDSMELELSRLGVF